MVKPKIKSAVAAKTETSLTQVGESNLLKDMCISLKLSKLSSFKNYYSLTTLRFLAKVCLGRWGRPWVCRQETHWAWGVGANLWSGVSPPTWTRMKEGLCKIHVLESLAWWWRHKGKCKSQFLLYVFVFRIVQQERFSLLTLVNTTVADTGEYACYPMYCEDRDCRKEYNKAIKVFIFFPGMIFILKHCCLG